MEIKGRTDFDSDAQKSIDNVLSRFYMARIGLRFLIEHHIESRVQREGFAGIIQSQCKPLELVEKAALDANRICTHHLGEAPSFDIIQVARDGSRRKKGDQQGDDIRFTYVPGHIMYMVTEVIKNASRATVEEWAKRGGT